MEKQYYLKTINKLRDDYKLPIQIIDTFQPDTGTLEIYLKQLDKADLRDFKRDLEASFGLKVTLQTLGAREITALIGGVGRCEKPLCCHTWLTRPLNVNTEAAMAEGLSGIPKDYTGVCGKLLCCLLYENDDFKLECANGERIRKKLKTESVEVRNKVAEARKRELTKHEGNTKISKKPRRVVRRFVR